MSNGRSQRAKRSIRGFVRMLSTLALTCAVLPAWGNPKIRITSPAEKTVVHPGDTVTVTVATSGEKFIMMSIEARVPIPDSENRTSPPWRFSIHIPTRITPGLYGLIASAVTTPGHGEESDPVPQFAGRAGIDRVGRCRRRLHAR
jgi:hypothetical protein